MNQPIYIHKNLLYGLFFTCIFASCRQKTVENPQLLKADALMADHPDSALTVLESIAEPAQMKEADQALYALLITQAHDKNKIAHTSDSLIRIAVDYYDDGNEPYREAQSLYYLGSVYEDRGNVPLSAGALLKAEEVLDKEYKNDRLLFLASAGLLRQYRKQGFYEKGIECGRKMYTNCINRNDSSDLLLALEYMASLFQDFRKDDSASVYLAKGLEIAEIRNDSSWIASFLSDLSEIRYSRGHYAGAYEQITKAIDYESDPEDLFHYYSTKGRVLYQLGKKDSARHFFLQSLQSDDIFVQYTGNQMLFEIEKDAANYKQSVEYAGTVNILTDSIYRLDRQAEIARLLNKHAIDRHTRKIKFGERKRTIYIATSCAIVLIITAFAFMMADKRKKSHIIRLQKQLMRNRTEALKINQQRDASEAADKAAGSEALQKLCIQSIQTSAELFKRTAAYKEIHSADKNNKEIHFHSQKRNRLKNAIDETFPDAFLSLRDVYSLTADDAYCCILYSLNLSNRMVASCMGVAEGAVKTRKSRIRNKIDERLSAFLFANNELIIRE